MGWHPYTDQKNRAYSNIMTSLFPEQTKTLLRTLVWGMIFLVDLITVIGGAFCMGWLQYDRYPNQDAVSLVTGLLILLTVGVFWLQGKIWYGIVRWIRKRKELG